MSLAPVFSEKSISHILWSSTSNVLILCVFISFPAFFMFGLWQFYYHVYRHGFIWVYSGFNKLLRSVDFFHQIETSTMYHHIFIPCFFKKIIPCLFICPVSFGDPICRCWTVWYFPMGHWTDHFSSIFFYVLFRFVDFNQTVLMFSDHSCLFPIWHQACESEHFHFRYCYFSF